MNARFKRTLEDGRVAPDGNEEYLLYQTIAGTWPWETQDPEDRRKYVERLQHYASKALSEAKVNLSWINPDPEYVKAVQGFLEDVLIPSGRRKETRFVEALGSLLPQLRVFGALNSLSQLLLKIASPGVPDFYQGNELWELTLVDPDNRRPVDYEIRSRHLDALHTMREGRGAASVCDELMPTFADGRIKLWTMWRALAVRKSHPKVFERGEYVALQSGKQSSDRSENVIAFARRDSDTGKTILAVVPRFACSMLNGKAEMPLKDAWGKAAILLPERLPKVYSNAFTDEIVTDEGGSLRLSSVFSRFPVAMLVSEDQ
jgi:(1->4)-alpha-D-glucan 1-alpha-D-glucosylmutase